MVKLIQALSKIFNYPNFKCFSDESKFSHVFENLATKLFIHLLVCYLITNLSNSVKKNDVNRFIDCMVNAEAREENS